MKLLIDMSLSPTWVEYFAENGVEALHWSVVGDPRAKDEAIMDHARHHFEKTVIRAELIPLLYRGVTTNPSTGVHS